MKFTKYTYIKNMRISYNNRYILWFYVQYNSFSRGWQIRISLLYARKNPPPHLINFMKSILHSSRSEYPLTRHMSKVQVCATGRRRCALSTKFTFNFSSKPNGGTSAAPVQNAKTSLNETSSMPAVNVYKH